MSNTAVYDLTVNYLKSPCGVDETPRFSYKIKTAENGKKQISRRICVYKGDDKKEKVWDSGVVDTAEQLFVEYSGDPLEAVTKYVFEVEVVLSDGEKATAESGFVTGKLGEKWAAKWINQRSVNRETDAYGAQYLRKTFEIERPVSSAFLVICGLGYFESYVNGTKTGDDVLSPAFTRYDEEIMYMTYDVKTLLKTGKNAIGVTLGNGWYNCFAEDPWNTRAATWKHVPKLICELHITYSDGTKAVVCSEPSWKSSKGPITFNGIRNGEFYDARLELGDWTCPEYDDSLWEGTKVMKSPGGILKAMNLEPIRVRAVIPAKKMWKTENGYAFDIGQNQAGVGHFKVRGEAGTEIKFRYSDVLREDGELDFSAIGCFIRSGEFQTDKYIKKSDEEEEWNAKFTYHGFQYIEVTGIDYEPRISDVCAYTLFTDVDVTGSFSCSDELFNKVQHMCRWSTVSNLHSIPTDNPHREKNGWTGDTSLSCEQMLINFGTRSLLSKWSGDMRTSQRPAGQIPCIVPSTGYGYYGLMGPDWSSAFIVVPYNIYLYNADKKIIRENYEPIKRNCDFMESMTVDYTLHYGTGDWCAPFEGPAISRNMGAYKCPVEVSDTGFFYNAAMTVVKMAEILGCPEDAEYYSELAKNIRKAFREKFFDKSTFTVKGDCQTATAVMLYFNLYEPDEYRPLVDKLISQIEKTDWHLDFGVLGCKFVMEVLGSAGEGNIGHRMLAQRTFPGCQRWIDLGATTLWECWNGGGSHNHHMFSSLSAFMYKYIGGICPDLNAPGFVHTIIRPAIDCGMESADASHESMLGKVSCSWKNTGSETTLDITVPFGGTATLYLPQRYADKVKAGKNKIYGRLDGKEYVIELENGTYSLSASFC
ncbi:MAG: family 78 glycoside hydrolase catalytic domain [Clostridia bacterium]|nr:family 78 glycoside hydrolase catalytic domain [Clostridia bacterium]